MDHSQLSLQTPPSSYSDDKFVLNEMCPVYEARDYSPAISNALKLGGILSIGESHGNRNSIDFVSQLMERVVVEGDHFVFLLETPSESEFLFDEVFNNTMSIDAALEKLPESKFWNEYTDGRQSCAILRLLIEINSSNYREQILFSTLTPETTDFAASRLKGHVMGYKAVEIISKISQEVSTTIVLLTGRNYQRFDPSKDLESQSSTCGTLKSSNVKKVTCIATVGKGLPRNETPCKTGEKFDLVDAGKLDDSFFIPFDMVLTSRSRCSDFTPLPFE